jgi:hypothetical protein
MNLSAEGVIGVLAREVQEWRLMRERAEGFRRFLGRKVKAVISDGSDKTVVIGVLLSVSEWGEFVIEDEGGGKTFCWPALDMEARDE